MLVLLWLATGCGKVKTVQPGEGPDASSEDAVCGDGRVQVGEDCDDEEETAGCDDDCTAPACGDGLLNRPAGEECERDEDAAWARCSERCRIGIGLSGEFSDHWIELAGPEGEPYLEAFQSFHYTGQRYLYELYSNLRYDIEANEWSAVETTLPFSSEWPNGAVDDESIWVPRDGQMHRMSLEDEEWTVAAETVPDGSTWRTAAVFDGAGDIWYHGPDDDLVRYRPSSDAFENFPHSDFPAYEIDETRVAYDPMNDLVAFTGYLNDRFLVFDIEDETFHEGTPSPEGRVRDNTCQDRSGHVYTGNADGTKMFRYDVGDDTWHELPPLPVTHDDAAGCVVSQDGFLYYATRSEGPTRFFRLGLEVE